MTEASAPEKRYQAYFVEWDRWEEAYVFDRDIFEADGVEHEGWDTYAEVIEWVTRTRAEHDSIRDIKLWDIWANDCELIFDGAMDAKSDWLALRESRYSAPEN